MTYWIEDVNFYLDDNVIKIFNGYKTTSKIKIKRILNKIKSLYPNCKIFTRSINSLTAEWVAHNRLYKIGYKQNRTKDVDLDLNETWFRKILYWILSI